MTVIKSDQAEHIILTIFEIIAANEKLRKNLLEEVELDDDALVCFLENVQVTCDDVRC